MSTTTGRSAPANLPLSQRGRGDVSRTSPRLQCRNGLRRDRDVPDLGAVLASAVEVAAAGRDEVVPAGEVKAVRGVLGRVDVVMALDPGEAAVDQAWEQLLEADDGPRVRERRHATVRADQLDRLQRRQPDPRDVSGRVLADDRVERRVVGRHVPGLEERRREMRPAERTTLRELEHPLEGDAVAEGLEALDHELDAAAAVLAEPAQAVLERRIRGIEEVAEDVHVAPFGLRVQLRRGDDADSQRVARGDRLTDA